MLQGTLGDLTEPWHTDTFQCLRPTIKLVGNINA